MNKLKNKATIVGIIVVITCCIIYYFLYRDILNDESSLLEHADQLEVSSNNLTKSVKIVNKRNISYFVNKNAIPFYPEIHNKTPWSSFHLNISGIITNLHHHGIETIESLDFITPHYKQSNIEHVNWNNQVPSYYMTCSNLRKPSWKYPIGIPEIGIRSTAQFDYMLANIYNNNYEKLKDTDFTQLIDLDALCMVHSPGFIADNTIFNKHQFYGFTKMWSGHYKCWANHTMHFLCDTSLNTCSKQGIIHHIILNGKPTKVINIAFRLTGWGANAFSHFHIFVVPQFAMIYNILVDLKKQSIDITNIDDNKRSVPIFYNITIVTHTKGANVQNQVIQKWFFKQFGLSMIKTTIITSYMNITITMSKSWCQSGFRNIHWSPLLISPYFLRYKEKYKGVINERWKLIARNTMLNIKPFITNMSAIRNKVIYMNRGTSSRRGVKNNDHVIDTLRQFVKNNSDRLPFEFEIYGHDHHVTRDIEKQYFSRVALMIGPHGGAFSNENLLQPGSYVTEFIDWWSDSVNIINKQMSKKFRPCYYALAQGGGLNYFYLKPESFDFDRGAMDIDINKLIKLMNMIYDNIEKHGFIV